MATLTRQEAIRQLVAFEAALKTTHRYWRRARAAGMPLHLATDYQDAKLAQSKAKHDLLEFVPSELVARLDDRLWEYQSAKYPATGRVQLAERERREFLFVRRDIQSQVLYKLSGDPVCPCGACRDAAERREQLRTREQKHRVSTSTPIFRLAIENLPAADNNGVLFRALVAIDQQGDLVVRRGEFRRGLTVKLGPAERLLIATALFESVAESTKDATTITERFREQVERLRAKLRIAEPNLDEALAKRTAEVQAARGEAVGSYIGVVAREHERYQQGAVVDRGAIYSARRRIAQALNLIETPNSASDTIDELTKLVRVREDRASSKLPFDVTQKHIDEITQKLVTWK